jgi:hypothetical protein
LTKLENEVSRFAVDRKSYSSDRTQAVKKHRPGIAAVFKTAKHRLGTIAASPKAHARAFVVRLRRLLTAVRGVSIPTITSKPKRIPSEGKPTSSKERTAQKSETIIGVLLAICFGLVIICSALFAMLMVQVRDMKSEMAHWQKEIASIGMRLTKNEQLAQRITSNPPRAAVDQPQHAPFALNEADRKIIRQFIKILPPKPGAEPSIHLGDEVPAASSVPVQQALIDQLPKLRGARFSIDRDGTIVIISQGSNHADAIVQYEQPR